MSLRDAQTLLRLVSEKLPPTAGKRHILGVRDEGRLAIALSVGPGFQWFYFDEADFDREPEELAGELVEMSARHPVGANARKLAGPWRLVKGKHFCPSCAKGALAVA